MIEDADDRAAFFDVDEFGTLATYVTRAGSAPPPIAGAFNDPHLAVQIGDGPAFSESRPTFCCRAADLPADAVGGDAGDMLTIATTRYRVVDIHADGTGLAVLILGA